MNGFADLANGGADCSGGNAMTNMLKHFDKDRSLEQDRFEAAGGAGPGGAGVAAFRRQQAAAMPPELAAEMEMAAATAGGAPFEFAEMHREIHGMNPPPQMMTSPAPQMTGWASDFMAAHAGPSTATTTTTTTTTSSQWGNELAQFNPQAAASPATSTTMNSMMMHRPMMGMGMGMGMGHMYRGGMSFQQQYQTPMTSMQQSQSNAVSTVESMSQEAFAAAFDEASKQIAARDNQQQVSINNELAETAARIIDSVNDTQNGAASSTDSKFANSGFMQFMHQLANEQATITDDGKVNVIGPTGVTGLEDRIEAAAARQAEQDGNIFSHNEATSLERNWTEEFEQTKADTTAAPQAAKDWADEFASKVAFDELDEALNNLSEADAEGWVKQYKENIAHLSQEPTDQEWAELQKEWEKYSVNSGGYRATDAALDKYAYTATDANRFASMESSQLDSILNKMHTDPASLELSDAIQALEARVQNNPTDAQAWHQLGLRQQENEQEKQAIAALRTAVRLDPTILDAWTALAVSYTNENYHTDAYVSLLRWMQNSDKYRSLVPPNAEQTVERVDQRHAIVEGMFLDAVELGMSSGDATLDPDVQVALGVLFNISEEYDKAVDCFQAALAHRPTDYVLFNKLGATLANSKSPSRAIDAYFTALEINPSYVRARYNLAISCISLRQYREAAEHLLTALSLQQRAADKIKQGSVSAVAGGGGADGDMAPDNANGTSDNVWDTLKMTLYMMNMPHLAHECRSRNLDTFRQEFQF